MACLLIGGFLLEILRSASWTFGHESRGSSKTLYCCPAVQSQVYKMEFEKLSRKELQNLCKEKGLKANGKNTEMVARLTEHFTSLTVDTGSTDEGIAATAETPENVDMQESAKAGGETVVNNAEVNEAAVIEDSQEITLTEESTEEKPSKDAEQEIPKTHLPVPKKLSNENLAVKEQTDASPADENAILEDDNKRKE
jgi:SAP domain